MKLIDMQLPKRSKKELSKTCEPCTPMQDKFPYGLRLHLEEDQITKFLSLKDVTIKSRLTIEAEASITEIRTIEKQEGKDSCTIDIQIEKLSVEPIKTLNDMSMKEYRKMREEE